jgi:type I restriction enzyme S subunit
MKSLGEVCEVGDGNHSSNYPKSNEMVETGTPFIRGTNLVNGTISAKNMKYITEDKHNVLKKGHLKEGDVLFMNRGEIGKIAFIPKQYENSNLNSQIAWLRAKRNILTPKYLFFILNTAYIQKSISHEGGALKQLTIKNLKEIEIPVPPLAEQERIVSILDKFDALVNDISIGLPAELKARRSQYEYYRNKLLTFNEYAK